MLGFFRVLGLLATVLGSNHVAVANTLTRDALLKLAAGHIVYVGVVGKGPYSDQAPLTLGGQGVLISSVGEVLTAKHIVGTNLVWKATASGIVDGRDKLHIYYANYENGAIHARALNSNGAAVITAAGGIDLALIKISSTQAGGGKKRSIGLSCQEKSMIQSSGQKLFVVSWRKGNFLKPEDETDLFNTLTLHEVKVAAQNIKRANLVRVELKGSQTNFQDGDSGAPVFTETGRLLGIFVERDTASSSRFGFFEPLANAVNLLNHAYSHSCGHVVGNRIEISRIRQELDLLKAKNGSFATKSELAKTNAEVVQLTERVGRVEERKIWWSANFVGGGANRKLELRFDHFPRSAVEITDIVISAKLYGINRFKDYVPDVVYDDKVRPISTDPAHHSDYAIISSKEIVDQIKKSIKVKYKGGMVDKKIIIKVAYRIGNEKDARNSQAMLIPLSEFEMAAIETQ